MALLTKSRYIQGIQCKKLLSLSLHQPLALSIDEEMSYRFDQGHLVGEYARTLFPDAQLIPSDLSFQEKLSTTQALLHNNKSMCEGSFYWNQCFCMVDLLIYRDGGWDLIEVKSSTGVKPIHYQDVGFQAYILSKLGIDIQNIYLCHINTDYIREGDLNVKALFSFEDVSAHIQTLFDSIQQNIYHLLPILTSPSLTTPIGEHCFQPYTCDAMTYCWDAIPDGSIFDLRELPMKEKMDAFFKGKYELMDYHPNDFSRPNQKRQIACIQEDLDFINIKALNEFISLIQYPISYLDFESFQMAVPPYSDMSPYEQIPFQFSLHIESDKLLTHASYIAPYGGDPRALFLQALIEKLPNCGSILVFNRQYESMILLKLKTLYPKFSRDIDGIISRLIDLEVPFKDNYLYLREMNGKTSIKSILPALCPSLSYDQLSISSGRSINQIYCSMADPDKRLLAINSLKEYAYMDTFAMVEIVKTLKFFLDI